MLLCPPALPDMAVRGVGAGTRRGSPAAARLEDRRGRLAVLSRMRVTSPLISVVIDTIRTHGLPETEEPLGWQRLTVTDL